MFEHFAFLQNTDYRIVVADQSIYDDRPIADVQTVLFFGFARRTRDQYCTLWQQLTEIEFNENIILTSVGLT